ncbi:MAG: BMP family ABC transporter substrate-binding protein [Desulfovibrionaceae bacterium]
MLFCQYLCAFVLALVLCVQGAGEAKAASQNTLKIALFLEDTQDAGYADVLKSGLAQAEKNYGARYDIILSPNPAKHESDFLRIATAGYDLVIVPTIAFHTLLINNAGNFPQTRFAAINTQIKAPNVLSFTFADAEGAFLAGAAAALLMREQDPTAAADTQKIAWVGGPDIPQSQGYLAGYRQGAKYIAPEMRVITVFTESFSDAAAGRSAAASLYTNGVGIIMHAGGRTGLGVIQAAKEAQRYAIGLISDQSDLAPNVIFSLEKHVDKAVLAAVQAVREGSFVGGNLVSFTLANGGLSLSRNPHLSSALSTRLDQISKDIQHKKITVNSGAGKGLCNCL